MTKPSQRRPLSTKTRFEVFKRDGFKCQYCGAVPPNVILQVDHIVAVTKGGLNSMDNLVTCCQTCNIGKGNKDLKSSPRTLEERAKETKESESQLRGYYKVMKAQKDRVEKEVWDIAVELFPECKSEGIRKDWFRSIRMFIEKIGYFEVLEAAEIAFSKVDNKNQMFKYFCGICWKKHKDMCCHD